MYQAVLLLQAFAWYWSFQNFGVKDCICNSFSANKYSVLGEMHHFFAINCYIHCQVESGRSVVKVELWNMIRLCWNLQLQIVWNWLEVLVLFGRHSAIGSIYLSKTTKVSGNTERGSQMVIFLLYTFFPPSVILGFLFPKFSVGGNCVRSSLRDFRVLFLAPWWRWTELFPPQDTKIPTY